MLSKHQLGILVLIEQDIEQIVKSPEFMEIVESGNYNPDSTLGDAMEAISYCLDWHIECQSEAKSESAADLQTDCNVDLSTINAHREGYLKAEYFAAESDFISQLKPGDLLFFGGPRNGLGSNSTIPFEEARVVRVDTKIRTDVGVNFGLDGRSTRKIEREIYGEKQKLNVYIYSPNQMVEACGKAIERKTSEQRIDNYLKLKNLVYQLDKNQDSELIHALLEMLD